MNYNKIIKDLKERNDKLQEQYRLRDIRCIHLEYENEMLKSDFEAQNELTKKYAEENKDLRKQLEAINEQADYLRKSIERKEETIIDLQNQRIPYTNEYVAKLENQQKEFINWLEENYKTTQDIWYVKILNKFKEIIGGKNERIFIKNN